MPLRNPGGEASNGRESGEQSATGVPNGPRAARVKGCNPLRHRVEPPRPGEIAGQPVPEGVGVRIADRPTDTASRSAKGGLGRRIGTSLRPAASRRRETLLGRLRSHSGSGLDEGGDVGRDLGRAFVGEEVSGTGVEPQLGASGVCGAFAVGDGADGGRIDQARAGMGWGCQ